MNRCLACDGLGELFELADLWEGVPPDLKTYCAMCAGGGQVYPAGICTNCGGGGCVPWTPSRPPRLAEHVPPHLLSPDYAIPDWVTIDTTEMRWKKIV
jgi:hypothetical protein